MKNQIIRGLQRLYLLRLTGAPSSAEELQGCALAWVDALEPLLNWTDVGDERIAQAFRLLACRVPRDGQPVYWPVPGELLTALRSARAPAGEGTPSRQVVRSVNDSSRAIGMRCMAEILARLPYLAKTPDEDDKPPTRH